MTRAFIGLGSNVGDRLQFLQHALKRLSETSGIQIIDVSSVYETEPVGPTDQPRFLNAVAAVDTNLSPVTLLDRTQAIEQALPPRREHEEVSEPPPPTSQVGPSRPSAANGLSMPTY